MCWLPVISGVVRVRWRARSAIVHDVLAAGDFWGGAGSVACQEFVAQLGRNFAVIYEQANSHGQKVQSAGNNMANTDASVGSSWA
ncbi:type VII secretion protein EsxI [Mycolicibacter virginiensis]|uniref:Type VII secretion protein EsxI n=1 Tax=Mycolicibacter virginiensis TaxID=1795032 RepID=A0A9X7IJ97_9MYCO|nr:type VII secretion protein EsxI [Mycolicibacter virginiensis]